MKKYHENKEFSSTEKDGRKKKKRKIGECNDVYLCTMFLISSILSIYLLRHILDNIYIETIICGCNNICVLHYMHCIYYAFVPNIITINN
jgi:hypothetical protein